MHLNIVHTYNIYTLQLIINMSYIWYVLQQRIIFFSVFTRSSLMTVAGSSSDFQVQYLVSPAVWEGDRRVCR